MGIVLAMLNCKRVNVYELFPSRRARMEQGSKYHYYSIPEEDEYFVKINRGKLDYHKVGADMIVHLLY